MIGPSVCCNSKTARRAACCPQQSGRCHRGLGELSTADLPGGADQNVHFGGWTSRTQYGNVAIYNGRRVRDRHSQTSCPWREGSGPGCANVPEALFRDEMSRGGECHCRADPQRLLGGLRRRGWSRDLHVKADCPACEEGPREVNMHVVFRWGEEERELRLLRHSNDATVEDLVQAVLPGASRDTRLHINGRWATPELTLDEIGLCEGTVIRCGQDLAAGPKATVALPALTRGS